MNYVNGE